MRRFQIVVRAGPRGATRRHLVLGPTAGWLAAAVLGLLSVALLGAALVIVWLLAGLFLAVLVVLLLLAMLRGFFRQPRGRDGLRPP